MKSTGNSPTKASFGQNTHSPVSPLPDSRASARSPDFPRPSMISEPSSSGAPCPPRCCCSKDALSSIGLEPVLFVQNVVSQLVYITSQDLMIEKACRVNHDLGPEVCSNLPDHDTTDQIIHDQVSDFLMWRDIFESSIKLVVVLFVGPWSDRWGRRTPLMACLLLLSAEAGLMLLNAHMTQWPLETMLLSSIPYGLSGGHYALLMLSFAHMADTSTNRRRTFRMGFLDIFWYFGKTIGLALKPLISDAGGYDAIFLSSIALYFIATAYVYVRLRSETARSETDEDEGRCAKCSLEHLSRSVAAVTKERPNRGRFHILVLIGIMMLDAFAATGEGNVKYLFVLLAADWTSSHYSYWSSLSSLLTVVGGFIVVPLLTLPCQVHDCLVGAVGAASRLAANLSYAVVSKPSQGWLLYLGSVLGSLSVLPPVTIRSLLSKMTAADVGSVFAVMAACESLMPFISAPVYRTIYNATDDHLPGAYNYFSALVHATMMALFGLVMVSQRRYSSVPSTNSH